MTETYRYYLEPAHVADERLYRLPDSPRARFHSRVYGRALDSLDALFAAFLGGGKTVVILTTSQSKYVASCVTNTAEKHGKWSRTFEDDAGMVLIIHEWGFAYPRLSAIKKECRRRRIPLVEDCARAFGSYFYGSCGHVGDYVVLSFGKFSGLSKGVLVCRDAPPANNPGIPLSEYRLFSSSPESIIKKRRRVFEWHCQRWKSSNLQWRPRANEVAESFLLPCEHDGGFMRKYMRQNGLEGGAWFGNRHLYLPCHQNLSRKDVNEIGDIVAEGLQLAPRLMVKNNTGNKL